MKYMEFEPHLDDILISLKTNLTQALLNKVKFLISYNVFMMEYFRDKIMKTSNKCLAFIG